MDLQELSIMIQEGFTKLEKGQNELKKEIVNLKDDVAGLKNDTKKMEIRLEEIDKKVDLSLEGHRANAEQLTIIKEQVTKHEEFIIKRVK